MKLDTDKAASSSSAGAKLLPFALVFPLTVIAFWGCVNDGCQGALNAQSEAIHTAVEAGGWMAD